MSFPCSSSAELDEPLVDKSCSESFSEKYLSGKTLKCDYRWAILMKSKEVYTHSPISLQKKYGDVHQRYKCTSRVSLIVRTFYSPFTRLSLQAQSCSPSLKRKTGWDTTGAICCHLNFVIPGKENNPTHQCVLPSKRKHHGTETKPYLTVIFLTIIKVIFPLGVHFLTCGWKLLDSL